MKAGPIHGIERAAALDILTEFGTICIHSDTACFKSDKNGLSGR